MKGRYATKVHQEQAPYLSLGRLCNLDGFDACLRWRDEIVQVREGQCSGECHCKRIGWDLRARESASVGRKGAIEPGGARRSQEE